MWKHYFPFVEKLRRVMAAMQLALCSSCFRYCNRQLLDEHPVLLGRGFDARYHHATGLVWKILELARPVPGEDIQKWFDDKNHGLLHGICTAIAGAMCEPERLISTEALVQQIKDCEPWETNYFLSAVLHDFCRGGMGMEDGHDAALEELFPGLLPETYSHSSPPPAFENSPLISGDRIELLRFEDHATWVDAARLQDARNKFKSPYVDIFYKCVRPALTMLYFHDSDIWLRHGLENRAINVKLPNTDWSKGYYPQPGSFVNVRDAAAEQGFSIDVGRSCLGHCMRHEGQWLHIQGVMPVKRFVEQGGAIRRCFIDNAPFKTYQHLCGVGQSPLHEWLFHYKTPLKENPYQDCLQPIFENGAMLLPTDIVETWQQIVSQWRERIELMLIYTKDAS